MNAKKHEAVRRGRLRRQRTRSRYIDNRHVTELLEFLRSSERHRLRGYYGRRFRTNRRDLARRQMLAHPELRGIRDEWARYRNGAR